MPSSLCLTPEQRVRQFPKAGTASPKKLPSGTTSNPHAKGRRGVRKCWLGQQNGCKVFHLGLPQNKVIFNRSAATGTGEEVAGQGHHCSIPWSQSCGTHRHTYSHLEICYTAPPLPLMFHLTFLDTPFLSRYLKVAGSDPTYFLGRKGHMLPSRAPPIQSWSLHAPASPFPSLKPLNSLSSL